MKKKLIVSLFIFLFGVTSATQTLAQSVVAAPTPTPTVPGAVGLFFRDIGQRIQLLVTVNSVRDASLRLEFAAENIALVEQMIDLQASRTVISRARNLVTRSEELVSALTRTQDKWSAGDPEALLELSKRADEYFSMAALVVEQIRRAEPTSEVRIMLQDTLTSLSEQNTETKTVLASKIVLQNTTPLREPFSPPTNDLDADGIEDTDETALGLSLNDFDTDADGISDRVEIEKFGTDPTKVDTDGDGYTDGLEIIKGFNPIGQGNFSTEEIKKNGFVFVKTKLTLPALSPATMQMLQEASEGKKLERYIAP